MDVIIVDDEPLARERLQRLMGDSQDCRVVGMAANGAEALQLVQECDPDMVLLDIEMPATDGLTLANQLATLEDPPAVIFCTAHAQHALDAFGVNAVDYLLKPVRQEKLQAALNKARRLSRPQRLWLGDVPRPAQRAHISARSRGGMELIPLPQIYYFLADQKYVTVFHEGGETLIDDTLKELEAQLGDGFVRVHRNALVPLTRIEALERDGGGQFLLRLSGTDLRPVVSRRHVATVRERLGER